VETGTTDARATTAPIHSGRAQKATSLFDSLTKVLVALLAVATAVLTFATARATLEKNDAKATTAEVSGDNSALLAENQRLKTENSQLKAAPSPSTNSPTTSSSTATTPGSKVRATITGQKLGWWELDTIPPAVTDIVTATDLNYQSGQIRTPQGKIVVWENASDPTYADCRALTQSTEPVRASTIEKPKPGMVICVLTHNGSDPGRIARVKLGEELPDGFLFDAVIWE
jgi:hypothetical protein